MIRVLVVDDSAVVRKVLSEELSRTGDIQVVGTAIDPYAARERIAELDPDVLTLDIEMPRMDGLSFLAKLMRHHPLPVVVVSSVTPENGETALEALRLGAVEVIPKPGSQFSVPDVRRHLARAIRAAARAHLVATPERTTPSPGDGRAPPSGLRGLAGVNTTDKLVALGASTGGTRALEEILRDLPPDVPGIIIVQHMPSGFTRAFAERLNDVSAIQVREAQEGDRIVPGRALVAPGGQHMLVRRRGAELLASIRPGPPVNYHRPSVDVLFQSVARTMGGNAVGAILTGMGGDGAAGLLEMRKAGAYTVVQDQDTSVVFGMPRVALEVGGANEVVPLPKMADALLRALREPSTGSASQPSRTAVSN